MQSRHLEEYLDLRRSDIDPEFFAAALAVQYVYRLIVHGGRPFGFTDFETVLQPQYLEAFLMRAIATAGRTKRFESEWKRLQQLIPRVKRAWKKGQEFFQDHLANAIGNDEAMEYLSMIDFAEDCYAYPSALRAYPDDPVLQAWAINGYLLAWREHFPAGDDVP
jgi:hypothetical protein